ncbi:MAG: type II secretion system protein [Nitrosomonadales bacterium]|nr:MAG: type II secretion system protein [Nitrosomonadales bacterium]
MPRVTITKRGFTLIEVIAVIALMGILAAYAAAGLNTDARNTGIYTENVKDLLRYAQKIAVAQHRSSYVDIVVGTGAGRVTATICANPPTCNITATIKEPGSGASLVANVPDGVTLNTTVSSLTFDASGKSSGSATVSITGGGFSRSICVVNATGYVHDC